jgi:hypothetical protein
MKYLFRGGFVHANAFYAGETVVDVSGIDFTSSYPSVMNKGYYPVTPWQYIHPSKYEKNLHHFLDKYCCLLLVVFKGIKATSYHSIESKSKCIYLEGEKIDNGRVHSAACMKVFLTELDFANYEKFYTWESMTVLSLQVSNRGKLPDYLLDPLNENYEAKARLKKEGKPYAIEKAYVNSGYGLTVTRLVFNDVFYDTDKDQWHLKDSDKVYDELISQEVLSPFWGIYICAHARYNELQTLWELREDVVYSDTDSHKIKTMKGIKILLHLTIRKWKIRTGNCVNEKGMSSTLCRT